MKKTEKEGLKERERGRDGFCEHHGMTSTSIKQKQKQKCTHFKVF